jgi:uncharacterized protein (DUF983 family)
VVVLAPYALDPPPTGRMLLRGLVGRCPLCGSGKLFRWWLFMVPECPRCDLHFERIEGHWIGAIAINTVLSFGLMLGVIVTGVVTTHPDIPTGALALTACAVALVVPLLLQPISRTFWTAIDLAMRPVEPAEIS